MKHCALLLIAGILLSGCLFFDHDEVEGRRIALLSRMATTENAMMDVQKDLQAFVWGLSDAQQDRMNHLLVRGNQESAEAFFQSLTPEQQQTLTGLLARYQPLQQEADAILRESRTLAVDVARAQGQAQARAQRNLAFMAMSGWLRAHRSPQCPPFGDGMQCQ